MTSLKVPQCSIALDHPNYHAVSQQMESLPWQDIAHVNWSEFPYKPDVKFQIAHDNQCIFIHYAVQEEFLKAQYVRINEAVWEDSCVEFFVSFDDRATYYNLEFNVVGTGLIGMGGRVKSERMRLEKDTVAKVSTLSNVVNIRGKKKWNIILMIPTDVFIHSEVKSLSGLTAYGNFFKCGDGLPTPHFLSWSKIDHPKPNFHLPDFFGKITFE